MAIAIDYTPACHQSAGIGRYVRELVAALSRVDTETSYRLFVAGAKASQLLVPPGPNFTWRSTFIPPIWLARLWHRAGVPYPINRWVGQIELFHATDFVLPPVTHKTRTILTVHDLSFVLAPETASPQLKQYLDRVVPQSIARADHILADSQSTRNDIIALYGTSPDKITVLLSGVDRRFRRIEDAQEQARVRLRYGLREWPFLFTVGTVQPRKNYGRLCEAFADLADRFADLHLVIAGGKGWLDSPIYETVERLGLRDRVHFIGFARDDDLPALYSMALAVPFVSLYEGFGLPVLEAMACGTPVIASDVSSIPEVAGDAALLVDPLDSQDIAQALTTALEDTALRSTLIARGYRQASSFTWERSAESLMHLYQQVRIY